MRGEGSGLCVAVFSSGHEEKYCWLVSSWVSGYCELDRRWIFKKLKTAASLQQQSYRTVVLVQEG